MNLIKILKQRIIHVFMSVFLANSVSAETHFAPKMYLQPIVGTNTVKLPGDNAFGLAKSCGVHSSEMSQYWTPTDKQIGTIDKKVTNQLGVQNSSTSNFKNLRLYFGLKENQKNNFIYVMIFPSSISKKLSLDFGSDKFDCLSLESMFEYSLNDFNLKRLK